mmetsp:Transcript_17128/g.69354  ORF Transcript_17128/g.69354 Transcript_17128/m.69354 type:complete len:213 (-) Transcript_17128:206-844(-)
MLFIVLKSPLEVLATASGAHMNIPLSRPATSWYLGLELTNMKPAHPKALGIKPGNFLVFTALASEDLALRTDNRMYEIQVPASPATSPTQENFIPVTRNPRHRDTRVCFALGGEAAKTLGGRLEIHRFSANELCASLAIVGAAIHSAVKLRTAPTTISQKAKSSSFNTSLPRAATIPITANPRPTVSSINSLKPNFGSAASFALQAGQISAK